MTTTGVFPGTEWAVESAADHGMDGSAMTKATEQFRAIDERFGLLVVRDGVIVHENYFRGDATSAYPTWSVTKGFGSSLVGIAQTQGLLHVSDLVSDWLPVHHPDIAEGATIEHVLSMTAAVESPGTRYQYTSGPILNSLPAILWQATGRSPAQFYNEELARPLNLSLTWPRNHRGWMQIGNQGPMPVMTATHRDLARLGQLWLNRGEWDGMRLIADDYVEAALRPPFAQANAAYGYLWWLNDTDGTTWRSVRGEGHGRRIANAPATVYCAIGAKSQVIMVAPEQRVVAVSMGNTEDSAAPQAGMWSVIAAGLGLS